jgi:hypothetical protein
VAARQGLQGRREDPRRIEHQPGAMMRQEVRWKVEPPQGGNSPGSSDANPKEGQPSPRSRGPRPETRSPVQKNPASARCSWSKPQPRRQRPGRAARVPVEIWWRNPNDPDPSIGKSARGIMTTCHSPGKPDEATRKRCLHRVTGRPTKDGNFPKPPSISARIHEVCKEIARPGKGSCRLRNPRKQRAPRRWKHRCGEVDSTIG